MGRHKRFLECALGKARLSKGTKRSKHCSIIVKGKDKMAVGFNSYITHSEMYKINKVKPYLHSEVDAIMSVRHLDLKGSTMYIARSTKAGKAAMSRPCSICMTMIRMFGIDTIVYTTDSSYAVERVA